MTKDPEGRKTGAAGDEYADDGAAESAPGDAEVHSITSAAPGHSVDMHQRMVRYSLAMGIRVVCIIALFFLDGWFKLIAVAGAVFLPWIAVVIANAQTQTESFDSELVDHVSYGELGTGYLEDDDAGGPETIQGEMVDDEATDDERDDNAPNDGRTDPKTGAA
ncbi:DUF3099 domain-containing protein [Sinomonas sp. P10A9]|uniref:DUF3099 domain-containing protein n=1 Tax=Sinomonas puerhi TaxID=3238584 RepID=A0AB39L9X3_9MICC